MRKIYKNFYYSSKSTRFAAFFVGRRFYMPHFQKRGNRIRASDKSPVFRFSAGSLLLLFLTAEPKDNRSNGLEIGSFPARWRRPSDSHALHDSFYHCGTSYRGAAALLYRRFQYDRVKQLFHRQSWQR